MQLFQGVELPQEAFCVRTFGLPEIRGSCLSLGRLPINRGCCPLSHWSCVSWAGFGWIVSRPHSSQLCQEGFGGIGEVGQHHWPRLLNKGEARLSLGGMEGERGGKERRRRGRKKGKKCFTNERWSLWREQWKGVGQVPHENNIAALMWKGKVINSSICSLLTRPFRPPHAGSCHSASIHEPVTILRKM